MTNFEKYITKAGEEYSLSQDERKKMSHVVREYMAMKPLPHAETYSISVSYRWITFAHRPMAAALVLVLIFGSSVSYAAEAALPGDALYTVKTYINEPTRVALATNAEAKAEVQIELAERRIEEAAVLAAEGRLDEETEDELTIAFESHAAAVAQEIAEADKEDDSASVELASRFENRLAAHENVLLEVESEGDVAHSSRLADAIRTATEESITVSLGNTFAITVATDDAEGTEPATIMMTTTIAPGHASSPADEVRGPASAPSASGLAEASHASSPDAKKISRMKSAAEKSLKNAQKKFKSAKSLTAEAHAQAEADFTRAESLITEGGQHLESDADAEAFGAFKESLRVSEQASVYMKAAPTLEKARARWRNSRTEAENRIDARVEVSAPAIDATVTLPAASPKETPEADQESDEPADNPPQKETEADIRIDLDLSL